MTGTAWPNAATLTAAADGSQIQPLSLSSTTTNDSGYYSLHVDPTTIPASYREPDGSVAIETVITVPSTGQSMLWDSSVVWNPLTKGWQDSSTGQKIGIGTTTQEDLGTGSVSESGYAAGDDDGAPVQTVVGTDPTVNSAGGTCNWTPGTWHKGLPEHFMNVDAWGGAPGTVTETHATSHTLQVGVSGSGSFDDLSGGGKVTVTESSDTHVAASVSGLVNKRVADRANYRDFSMWCYGKLTKWRERRPVSVYDYLDSDLFTSFTHTFYYSSCGAKPVNGHWSSGSAHSAGIGGGVDIGPINVSAQAGFTDNTELRFDFNKAGYVCGNSTFGPVESSRVDTSPND